ncbi:MAG TPA: ATP-binding cassette domain-containing protein, partial [Nitrospirae bacterium]|nr:ATP-binding cassette domain-containing protein [Nitrospirota bacterium]
LFPWKTVLDNVIYGPVIQKKMSREEAIETARDKLSRLGLKEIENVYPGQLSSGMQRRVEIVRALINNPLVLLLDEPFRGMDSVTKSASHEALLELYDIFHKTIYFITHDLEEAIFLSDTVVVMTTRPGKIRMTIKVDLPRPRDYRMLSTPRFLELKEMAKDAVHEEALKAFQRGERELA